MWRKRKNMQSGSSLLVPQIIGVQGVSRGCGVTHMCLTMANYMAHVLGRKTLYVEQNGSGQISGIIQKENLRGDCICYHGIWITMEEKDWEPGQVLQQGFETVIFDFGYQRKGNPKATAYCSRHFLIADGAAWKQDRLAQWFEENERTALLQYDYLILYADKKILNSFHRNYQMGFESIPFQQNPFDLRPTMSTLLEKLF